MKLIRFTDAGGRQWEVWEVGARSQLADRPEDAPGAGSADRWLCFASDTEHRRLRTYPPSWHALSPRELDVLRQSAEPARARRTPPGGQPGVPHDTRGR